MDKPNKSDEYWKTKLTDAQYRVCRQKGTEKPFSGSLLHNTMPGKYLCVCCEADLFGHDAKYDSGSGWPSFFEPLSYENLKLTPDFSLGQMRIEVGCKNCQAHLGHVFDDGPKPTGKRYCINSVALKFMPKK